MADKLSITLSFKQYQELAGLAYHVADANYIRERFGSDDPEHEVAHQNVVYHFSILDRLGVPFWVQNTVICWAENWRNYLKETTSHYLENHKAYDISIDWRSV